MEGPRDAACCIGPGFGWRERNRSGRLFQGHRCFQVRRGGCERPRNTPALKRGFNWPILCCDSFFFFLWSFSLPFLLPPHTPNVPALRCDTLTRSVGWLAPILNDRFLILWSLLREIFNWILKGGVSSADRRRFFFFTSVVWCGGWANCRWCVSNELLLVVILHWWSQAIMGRLRFSFVVLFFGSAFDFLKFKTTR